MKYLLVSALATAIFSCCALAQTPPPDPAAEAQALKAELEALKQRLNALEAQNAAANAAAAKAAADAQAAAASAAAAAASAAETPATPEPVAEPVDPWLVSENWQKLLRGSDESIVKGLLGRPSSTNIGAASTTWIYEDPAKPELGSGHVQFMKGRGVVGWQPPKFPPS